MLKPRHDRAGERHGRFGLLALLIHVAVLGALWTRPLPSTTPVTPAAAEDTPVDLAIEPAPVPVPAAPALPTPPPEATGPAARAPRAPRPPAAIAVAEATKVEPGTPENGARGEVTPEPAPEAPPLVLTVPKAGLTPAELGIGSNPFLPKSAAEVEAAESKRQAEAALKNTMTERDRSLGLGPEGPVLTALADGTSRSVAPVNGRAVFIATANAAGEVISLELADAEGTGGRPSWADAGRIAFEDLKKKKLRIPAGKTRAVMRIEVVSGWKMPSGQDPGNNITLFGLPLSKGEGKDSPTTAILDPTKIIQVDQIEIAPGVKVPIVRVHLPLLTTNVDPTNIGAKPLRVIHSRLLDSTVM
jgi:hypothetical protein